MRAMFIEISLEIEELCLQISRCPEERPVQALSSYCANQPFNERMPQRDTGCLDLIQSCEHCNAYGAEIPFDNILDRVTGSNPSVTDYILEVPAKCPNCRREILEKTLVEPA